MKLAHPLGGVLAAATVLTVGCGTDADGANRIESTADTVTVSNCEEDLGFPSPPERMFVNDGGLTSMVLALGQQDRVRAVGGIPEHEHAELEQYFGTTARELQSVSEDYPTMESTIDQQIDLVVAGWDYGYDESTGFTPQRLRDNGIPAYTLTESCPRSDGQLGLVDPWTAAATDIENLGVILQREDRAQQIIADQDQRLTALKQAPQADERPTVFFFDTGDAAPSSSGRFGGPEAIIDAAGGVNVFTDVDDAFFEASWEAVVRAEPDAIAIIEDPSGPSVQQKIDTLRSIPGLRDLPAVTEERFLPLHNVKWISGTLNITAAEELRAALEGWELVPGGGPQAQHTPAGG